MIPLSTLYRDLDFLESITHNALQVGQTQHLLVQPAHNSPFWKTPGERYSCWHDVPSSEIKNTSNLVGIDCVLPLLQEEPISKVKNASFRIFFVVLDLNYKTRNVSQGRLGRQDKGIYARLMGTRFDWWRNLLTLLYHLYWMARCTWNRQPWDIISCQEECIQTSWKGTKLVAIENIAKEVEDPGALMYLGLRLQACNEYQLIERLLIGLVWRKTLHKYMLTIFFIFTINLLSDNHWLIHRCFCVANIATDDPSVLPSKLRRSEERYLKLPGSLKEFGCLMTNRN